MVSELGFPKDSLVDRRPQQSIVSVIRYHGNILTWALGHLLVCCIVGDNERETAEGRRGNRIRSKDGRRIRTLERDEHNRQEEGAWRNREEEGKKNKCHGESVYLHVTQGGKGWEPVIRKTNHFIHKTWALQRHMQPANCRQTEFELLWLREITMQKTPKQHIHLVSEHKQVLLIL